MLKKEELEVSIQQNLYENFAKDFKHARYPEIYTALATTLRQIIGEKWFHSLYDDLQAKRLYILSFEYSIGDNLLKNLIKLDIYDQVKEILEKHNIKLEDILNEDIEFALGFGELGAVSGYLLEYITSFHKNVYAYGLRYRNGMLKQEILDGEQVEKPDYWRVNQNPWEHEKGFSHKVEFKHDIIKAIPYDIPIVSREADNVNTLRLWKSFSNSDLNFKDFSKGNIQEAYREINRANSIVEFLYPSEDNLAGKKLRLEQEYFFASATIQDILKKYKKYVGKDISEIDKHITIQINDVHPAMSILVFIDLVMKKYNYTFDAALDLAKKIFVYLQLSILPETYEKWDIAFISQINPDLMDLVYDLDKHLKDDLNEKHVDKANEILIIHDGKVDLINILYGVSKKIISIVKDHKILMENKYLTAQFNAYKDKFEFLNSDFDTSSYYKERLVTSNIDKGKLEEFEVSYYPEIKKQNKIKLIKSLNVDSGLINFDSSFIMHLGNFHENKRQILSALSIGLTYMRLCKNPNKDMPERTYLFAGKSYPNYYLAKESIKFINALAKLINNDLYIKDKMKVVFIENYNLSKSNLAIPASDIFLNLDLLNMESNKLQLSKAISSSSAILSSKSNYENSIYKDSGIKIETFGDSIENIINNYKYNMHDFIKANPEINELFNFFRTMPKNRFPYDIDKIYNAIYYFNDANFILKDLYDYTDRLEELVIKYSRDDNWYKDLYDNTLKLLSRDRHVYKYLKIMES